MINDYSIILDQQLQVSNTTTTIYTVPTDKELHIYSAWLNSCVSAAGTGHASIRTDSPTDYLLFIQQSTASSTGDVSNSNAVSYPEPLIIDEGIAIEIRSTSAACTASGGFMGYLYNK